MEGKNFWKDLDGYVEEVLNILFDISKKSYVSVVNLRTGMVWWSEKLAQLFKIGCSVTKYGEAFERIQVHPEDKEMVRREMISRAEGRFLEDPFEWRVRIEGEEYNTFVETCKLVCDADGEPLLLINLLEDLGNADSIDSITGLHTEEVFTRQISDLVSKCSHAALIKVGIEHFSNINVMYGADYANRVLKQVADALMKLVKGAGVVYRLSGAKFAIYLHNADRELLDEFYGELADTLAERICVDGRKIPLKICCGAIILDYDLGDVSSIKSRLTYALNRSRHNQHGSLVLFNDEICSNVGKDNLELITVIHDCALRGCDGFFLCYQPIVDTETGEIKGMEALLRWKKEPYGIIPPGIFIEWLEDDPCIYELGNWIIRQSLNDLSQIIKERPDFFVNVNVSGSQLERHEFREAVMQMLKDSKVPAKQLCIELTERCRELDIDFLRNEIRFFKSKGIKVAMDDFGTGSASLSLALDLPIDELKIDMSFVKNIKDKPTNQAMVKSIVDYARNTSLETCIEGVEDRESLEYLKRYGATWQQGYFYSEPVPIEEFLELLKKDKVKK